MADVPRWDEADSAIFLRYGDLFVPSRDEWLRTLLSLVPADRHEPFAAIDLGCGGGALTVALLDAFPACRVTAVDSSPSMLHAVRSRAAGNSERLTTLEADLRDPDMQQCLPGGVRAIVSSLAIHHLDGEEKQALYAALSALLTSGGALLIFDLVEPVSFRAMTAYADLWDRLVADAASAVTAPEALLAFRDGWNHYSTPDVEFDKPSPLRDNLRWLDDAGLLQVDCFWLRAGHALFGGYRPNSE
jgi:trans-aconitate methyltransferase